MSSYIDPVMVLELMALGVCSGFLAGLLGIGGGMVLVPFMTLIISARGVENNLAIKMAIATSMATILFTSLSSMRAHHKRGAVRWDIVRTLAPGIIAGGLASSLGVFALLKGAALGIFFGLFVAFSATQMLRKPKNARLGKLPPPIGQVSVGAASGFLSGLVGAGGGFLSVPFMLWAGVPMHFAVATSAALGFPIAASNSLGYIWGGQQATGLPAGSWGYIYLPALASVACVSILTAPLGARVAHRLPVATLKKIFAFVLYALALYMFLRGMQAAQS